ncbi:hypothetical protein KP509_04G045100 [Ceratopteris richardii]|nr:hypothetical protein KP509_04G045100 [Ceratopteris richardii]
MEHTSFTGAEDWQAELEATKKQYEAALLDLQLNKQAVENLKHELFLCIEAKDEAVRLAGEAMNAAESTAKRVEEMSAELIAAKGSTFETEVSSASFEELIVDLPSLGGVVEADTICNNKKMKAATLLAAKETELENSFQEARTLRCEVESLKRELALAKKLSESHSMPDVDWMETAIFLAAKDAQVVNTLHEDGHLKPEAKIMKEQINTANQLAEHLVGADKGDSLVLLTAKGAEIKSTLQEATHSEVELQSSRQEDAQTEEMVEAQVAQQKCKEEGGKLVADREYELQEALQELNYFKAETERLQRELAVAQNSVMQQAQGNCNPEVMSNPLYKTCAETKVALEEISHLKCEMKNLQEKLALSQGSIMQQRGGSYDLKSHQTELAAAKQAEIDSQARIMVMMSEMNQLNSALKESKLNEDRSTAQLEYAVAQIELLKHELTVVNEAKEKALHAENAANAHVMDLSEEIRNVKESESATSASLSEILAQLNTTEENLAKSTLEVGLLTGLLESLKADFEKLQLDLASAKEREAMADHRVELLKLELARTGAASQDEAKVLNDQLASTRAALELLRDDAERQRLELLDLERREALASGKVVDLTLTVQKVENELADLRQQLSFAAEEKIVLSNQLEMNVREIKELQEREVSINAKLTELTETLGEKEHVVTEWRRKFLLAENTSTTLRSDLKNAMAELLVLKERESFSSARATALSVVLTSLVEKSEARSNEQKVKEALMTAKLANLNEELNKTKRDLHESLAMAKLARDEVEKLETSLQQATLETASAREESHVISAEAGKFKEDAGAALLELHKARAEIDKAREAAHEAEVEVQKRSHEVDSLTLSLKITKDESAIIKQELDSLTDRLQHSMAEQETLKAEIEWLRQEAQQWRKDVQILQSSLAVEKEQTILAKNEAQIAWDEVEKIKRERNASKINAENSESLQKSSECTVKDDALEDVQISALDGNNLQKNTVLQVHMKGLDDNCSAICKELQQCNQNGLCKEDSSVQMRTNEIESNFSLPDETLELKKQLQQTEEQLAFAMQQIENSRTGTQNLLKKVETLKVEKEANEKVFLELHQHLADMESAKSNLEAEIQRLLDESKQRQTTKDAIDIAIHSEALGWNYSLDHKNLSLDRRDVKPQPDLLDEATELMDSPLSKATKTEEELVEIERRVRNENSITQREFGSLSMRKDDLCEKEETSSPTKKKKKTLFVRLGTLLEKKKHASPHIL